MTAEHRLRAQSSSRRFVSESNLYPRLMMKRSETVESESAVSGPETFEGVALCRVTIARPQRGSLKSV